MLKTAELGCYFYTNQSKDKDREYPTLSSRAGDGSFAEEDWWFHTT